MDDKEYSVVGKAPVPSEPSKKPTCPDHGVQMKYNPTEDRMECSISGCRKAKYRRRSFKGLFANNESDRPVVYRGAIEVVFDEDGTPFLYLVDVKGMVDISELVRDEAGDVSSEIKKVKKRLVNDIQDMYFMFAQRNKFDVASDLLKATSKIAAKTGKPVVAAEQQVPVPRSDPFYYAHKNADIKLGGGKHAEYYDFGLDNIGDVVSRQGEIITWNGKSVVGVSRAFRNNDSQWAMQKPDSFNDLFLFGCRLPPHLGAEQVAGIVELVAARISAGKYKGIAVEKIVARSIADLTEDINELVCYHSGGTKITSVVVKQLINVTAISEDMFNQFKSRYGNNVYVMWRGRMFYQKVPTEFCDTHWKHKDSRIHLTVDKGLFVENAKLYNHSPTWMWRTNDKFRT